ncbi:glycosyl transferase family 28 [Pseudonocardia sediminis]|uniref:Glycosyl transferase family 28 n=1 Tax=Pseudonocardia sediminis TaxID=1397368 RepID=A0A4Q7UZ69_PSEST|nr:glycosyltransferase [Pseudonocardia sediminis]RZT87266.1 glycosyl transferase family 28 [Pseudonocardia sediminis]
MSIAFYVHHHGSGHSHRAAAVASHLRSDAVGLSSRAAPAGWAGRWVHLPDDADGDTEPVDATAGGVLHWAPEHHPGLRERTAAISAELAGGDVALVVTDVSAEVSLLARLHGVPVVVMAQPGDRTDRTHRLAFDLATRLLAPWPETVGPPAGWPDAWHAKTTYLTSVSRFDGRPPPGTGPCTGTEATGGRRVLVLWGSGGIDVSATQLRGAAAAAPGWTWEVAGPPAPSGGDPPNLTWCGWTDDVWAALHRADVVVTHAGQNAVAEVAAARRPAVVVPQDRPHDEQRATGRALTGLATVVTSWPEPACWPRLLDDAARRGGAGWSAWSSGTGARRAAAVLDALVGA